MLWFWGTVAAVLAVAVVTAWFFDRRRTGGSGLTDRERAAFERGRNDAYRAGDTYGAGGGGFDGGGVG
ncbi:hypothetical protein [Knoellia aerolata]|uniref:Uncharacterized protein n=1 Tax=Knoellia aerolata DSM 18566 TaxID=1385519 RepID=A0A0A0K3M0_9MICO|nr:hypothetical protein [Knoellia aerolata]KGN42892.1 hypothetical protein N801_11530 [Knoellia aerolata DSM 18566]